MKVYLLCRKGPEWNDVVCVYIDEKVAQLQAMEENEEIKHAKDPIEKASVYVVVPHELNTHGWENGTFDRWIREQGVNPRIYTDPNNPGGAYGWAKKAWFMALALGGKK